MTPAYKIFTVKHFKNSSDYYNSILTSAVFIIISLIITMMITLSLFNTNFSSTKEFLINIMFLLPFIAIDFVCIFSSYLSIANFQEACKNNKDIQIRLYDINNFITLTSIPEGYILYYLDKDGAILCKKEDCKYLNLRWHYQDHILVLFNIWSQNKDKRFIGCWEIPTANELIKGG